MKVSGSYYLLALAAALFCLGGCAVRVIPPESAEDVISVHVADYGQHSSLLLPTGTDQLIEYSFGDWQFYSLGRKQWYQGLAALGWSGGSGLGRRLLPHPGDDESLRRQLAAKRLLSIPIPRRTVESLLADLDRRYHRHIETLTYNAAEELYFVRDDRPYSLLHTCNAETADWLRQLGCRIEGWPVLSNFRIAAPNTQSPGSPAPSAAWASDPPADRAVALDRVN